VHMVQFGAQSMVIYTCIVCLIHPSEVKRTMRETKPNNADKMKAAIKATWAS
ncbi:hypothetical protein ATANTOWER_012030, partial [Ataeniobius toweri]|nr:hypothetical protein [Ataeniobius toweri]